ncbi:hypothetical protein [Campylobacter sp. RM15925]|uniref:hypothetical protein n=1 Tax=Campylobacter sp. RM15925 TaxID=1705724 RepID=UPI0014766E79|nr:hypothetical protein [Campylobacter sp. RM15925]
MEIDKFDKEVVKEVERQKNSVANFYKQHYEPYINQRVKALINGTLMYLNNNLNTLNLRGDSQSEKALLDLKKQLATMFLTKVKETSDNEDKHSQYSLTELEDGIIRFLLSENVFVCKNSESNFRFNLSSEIDSLKFIDLNIDKHSYYNILKLIKTYVQGLQALNIKLKRRKMDIDKNIKLIDCAIEALTDIADIVSDNDAVDTFRINLIDELEEKKTKFKNEKPKLTDINKNFNNDMFEVLRPIVKLSQTDLLKRIQDLRILIRKSLKH